jgi:two-component system, OmpR family, response regulator MprA
VKRVLLVEDEPEVAEGVADFLRGLYAVEIAVNGMKALERLDEEPFDVVIVDMVMPVLDGLSLMRKMAEWEIHVPVVVASGIPELGALGGQLGAKAVLIKPYDPDALLAAIERALRSMGDA